MVCARWTRCPHGSSLRITPLTARRAHPHFRSTHNGYAKVFIEYGVLGLLLLIATFFTAIASFSSPLRTESDAQGDLPGPNIHAMWGFGASLIAGAVIMFSTAAIELAAPMALLTASLISLTITTRQTRPTPSAPSSRGVLTPLVCVAAAAAMMFMGAMELTAGYHRGKADQLQLYGRFELAHKDYSIAHEMIPAHGETLYNFVLSAWRTGDAVELFPKLEEAVKLRPHDARPHHLKGQLHLMRREFKLAIDAEKTAISLFPTYLDAYENLNIGYDRNLDFESATKFLEQAISLNPPRQMLIKLHSRAASIYTGPLNNPAKAITHLEAVIPMVENRATIEQLTSKLTETKKQIERDKLMREGKQVPAELLPADNHADHNHFNPNQLLPGTSIPDLPPEIFQVTISGFSLLRLATILWGHECS